MRKVHLYMFFLCIAGALLNVAIPRVTHGFLFFGVLFLDTIVTVSFTLLFGPVWGAITGALSNIISHTIESWGWEIYLFTLCNIATALITYLFMRLFPRELSLPHQQETRVNFRILQKSQRLAFVIERVVVLILLSFALCIAMSILGGLIAAFIQTINPSRIGASRLSPNDIYAMFPQGFSLILGEILVRIPINIVDRLISAFSGYGIALALSVFICRMKAKRSNLSKEPRTAA